MAEMLGGSFGELTLLAEHAAFGGIQRFYQQASSVIGLPMKFSVYLPAKALQGSAVPALLYLAGLTCNEETFATKAGAQRVAAELGLALIAPDTSPRGANVEGEAAAWDFGVGAGFYLDATQLPWERHWRMESWLLKELLPAICKSHPINAEKLGIFGHSMGGHGALTLALRNPGLFKSLSAFAPICAPMQCPWGKKAFSGYLGSDHRLWLRHDATELMMQQEQPPYPEGILIDQGSADKFLVEQLHPHLLMNACSTVKQPLTLNHRAGYDHGYYFVASFMESHMRFHADRLR